MFHLPHLIPGKGCESEEDVRPISPQFGGYLRIYPRKEKTENDAATCVKARAGSRSGAAEHDTLVLH